jgi:flagellar biosynthesis GTPase FlhF
MDPEQEDTQHKMDGSPNEPPPNSPGEEMLNMQETPKEHQANGFDQVHASIVDMKGQLRELATIMGQSALAKDSKTSLYRLQKEVIKLTKFEYPETRTVGFIGTTGVGLFSLVILGAKKKAAHL